MVTGELKLKKYTQIYFQSKFSGCRLLVNSRVSLEFGAVVQKNLHSKESQWFRS